MDDPKFTEGGVIHRLKSMAGIRVRPRRQTVRRGRRRGASKGTLRSAKSFRQRFGSKGMRRTLRRINSKESVMPKMPSFGSMSQFKKTQKRLTKKSTLRERVLPSVSNVFEEMVPLDNHFYASKKGVTKEFLDRLWESFSEDTLGGVKLFRLKETIFSVISDQTSKGEQILRGQRIQVFAGDIVCIDEAELASGSEELLGYSRKGVGCDLLNDAGQRDKLNSDRSMAGLSNVTPLRLGKKLRYLIHSPFYVRRELLEPIKAKEFTMNDILLQYCIPKVRQHQMAIVDSPEMGIEEKSENYTYIVVPRSTCFHEFLESLEFELQQPGNMTNSGLWIDIFCINYSEEGSLLYGDNITLIEPIMSSSPPEALKKRSSTLLSQKRGMKGRIEEPAQALRDNMEMVIRGADDSLVCIFPHNPEDVHDLVVRTTTRGFNLLEMYYLNLHSKAIDILTQSNLYRSVVQEPIVAYKSLKDMFQAVEWERGLILKSSDKGRIKNTVIKLHGESAFNWAVSDALTLSLNRYFTRRVLTLLRGTQMFDTSLAVAQSYLNNVRRHDLAEDLLEKCAGFLQKQEEAMHARSTGILPEERRTSPTTDAAFIGKYIAVMADLAETYQRLSKFSSAIKINKIIISVLKQGLGDENHPALIKSRLKRADCLRLLWRMKEAEAEYESILLQGEAIARKNQKDKPSLGQHGLQPEQLSDVVGECHLGLGLCALAREKASLAREKLDLALKIFLVLKETHQSIRHKIPKILSSLADVEELDENNVVAKERHTEALNMRKKLMGPKHPVVAHSRLMLALFLSRKNDHDAALREWQIANTISTNIYGFRGKNMAIVSRVRAELYFASGMSSSQAFVNQEHDEDFDADLEMALKEVEESSNLYAIEGAANVVEVQKNLMLEGQILMCLGEPIDAKNKLSDAIEFLTSSLGDNPHPLIAKAHFEFAKTFDLKDSKEAFESRYHWHQALRMISQTLGEDSKPFREYLVWGEKHGFELEYEEQ